MLVSDVDYNSKQTRKDRNNNEKKNNKKTNPDAIARLCNVFVVAVEIEINKWIHVIVWQDKIQTNIIGYFRW